MIHLLAQHLMLASSVAVAMAGMVAIAWVVLRRHKRLLGSEFGGQISTRKEVRAPWRSRLFGSRAAKGNGLSDLKSLLQAVDEKLDTLLSRDEYLSSLQSLYHTLDETGKEVHQVKRHLEALRSKMENDFTPPLPDRTPPALREGAAGDAVPQGPKTVPVTQDTVPNQAAESARSPSDSVEQIVSANFDEIDLATDRNFGELKSRFERLLRGKVTRIEILDNAVLFFKSRDVAVVHPWKNTRLSARWIPFFDLNRGANVPIMKVERPAVLKKIVGDEWEVQQRGYARNDY